VTAVHQVLPAATPADAVTGQAFAWRDLLADWGHAGGIFAEHVHPDLTDEVRRLDRNARRMLDEAVVVLRYAIWSKSIDVALQRPPERVALCYHNITPGQFLRPFNPELAELCDRGRRALADLPAPGALIADSEFNAGDLQAAGLGRATIVPLLLDLPETEARVHGAARDPIILTVGRVVPNKRLEDVIKAFALYQRYRAPSARLVLIGSARGFENYRRALEQLTDRIGAEQVFFTGPISSEARDAWYKRADAYLSMSVHEGFCAPVVEALAHGTPVVARAAGAVPETLAGAGVVLDGDDLPLVAEALHEVVSSTETRKALADAAALRLKDLRPEAVAPRIRAALAPILAGA
jgi:glycosyltransferase involved in cell wall biosynthesis